MKIVIFSRLYPPSIGGLESVMSILAKEFLKAGHQVSVITDTLGDKDDSNLPVRILRRIGFISAAREVAGASVVLHANISLKEIWISLLFGKPTVVIHHTWYKGKEGKIGLRNRLKLALSKLVTNVSVSRAISFHLPASSHVIENPYDADCFKQEERKSPPSGDIIAVGRLVSDKGFNVLLDAASFLSERKPTITIVGDGPERRALIKRASTLGIDANFVGRKSAREVASLLNAHKLMVIPSIWEEPFGVVALEALGCGCKVVASDVGGLKDALGGFGKLVPAGDPNRLSQEIAASLDSKELKETEALRKHLFAHSPSEVSKRYLSIFKELAQ